MWGWLWRNFKVVFRANNRWWQSFDRIWKNWIEGAWTEIQSKIIWSFRWTIQRRKHNSKVHIFWEGHKIMRNLHRRFDWHCIGQIYDGDFAKFCGILRIYELYIVAWWRDEYIKLFFVMSKNLLIFLIVHDLYLVFMDIVYFKSKNIFCCTYNINWPKYCNFSLI